MNKFLLVVFIYVFSFVVSADVPLAENCVVKFANKKQAGVLLSQKDDYVARLSKFDLTAKMQLKKAATRKKFLSFSRKQGLNWTEAEQDKFTAIIADIRLLMQPFAYYLPKEIQLVKTTGRVESGAFYTRGTSIFVSQRNTARSPEQLTTVILHEIFHIITRNNPELRDQLYAAIGFIKTSELILPKSLVDRKISNPDVPILTHLIKVKINGESHWATPFIYASRDYDRTVKRVFFQYLQLGMLAYRWDGKSEPQAVIVDGKPLLVPVDEADNLYEQIGRNTEYLFHAEEVLADNFALLVQGHNAASPEVLDRMRAAFEGN